MNIYVHTLLCVYVRVYMYLMYVQFWNCCIIDIIIYNLFGDIFDIFSGHCFFWQLRNSEANVSECSETLEERFLDVQSISAGKKYCIVIKGDHLRSLFENQYIENFTKLTTLFSRVKRHCDGNIYKYFTRRQHPL